MSNTRNPMYSYTRDEIDALLQIAIGSNFERGTWTPKLYDGDTFRKDLPVSPWFRIGDLYIAICDSGYVLNGVQITSCAIVENIPFARVMSATGFARYNGAASSCDSFQGSDTGGRGSVILRNMSGDNNPGTFGSSGSIQFIAFGYR